jgi:hypothetical protein
MNEPTNHALSVWAGGRKRKLYRMKPGGNFHLRLQVRGRDIVRSMGTTNKALARDRAKQIVEDLIDGRLLSHSSMSVRLESALEQFKKRILEICEPEGGAR